jgi:NitT/TauT family transport system ATP-binding protein
MAEDKGGPFKLEVRGLSKRYQIPVIEALNLGIRPGEFVCLLGPNGCGKTTFLRILAGLEQPDTGEILIDGESVDLTVSSHHRIGVVFQEPRLLPWRTAMSNIVLCLAALGVHGKEARERAQHYLSLVGLRGFENYYPNRLSGGMQQRVSIARALAVEPDVLLMDEPFSALDPESRQILQDEVVKVWRATGKTIIFVTHSLEEATYIGTRIVLFSARPARIRGSWELDGSSDRVALREELGQLLAQEVRQQQALMAQAQA